MSLKSFILLLAVAVCWFQPRNAWATGIEIFGKGSISKNLIEVDKSTISVSMSGGLAVALFSRVRLEGRYSHISSLQNKMDVVSSTVLGTLSDIYTQTQIYSLGLDIEFVSEKSAFQPFIFLGGGYLETERSYYFTPADNSPATYFLEPKRTGISVNAGAGVRIRFSKVAAFEVEVMAYGLDVHLPNPLINMYGTAGLRFYL